MTSPGLEVQGATKRFPGTVALDEVDLQVRYGRATVLLGENGAGKSTLMKVLSGVHQPDGGRMLLDGQPYAPSGPAEAAAAGVVLIHQELSLLPNLSVAENILLGRQPVRRGRIDRAARDREALRHLERVGLPIDPDVLVGRLSVAVQQQVEIAKALSQQPRILVFDEPTASLGGDEVEHLYRVVDGLKADGVGIVWITHRLVEVPRVGDDIVVLRDGRRVGSWDAVAGVSAEQMVESMVGRPVDAVFPDPAPRRDDVLLSVRDLGRPPHFRGVSFDLHAGEVLGVAGLVGAGRSSLVSAMAGAAPPTEGSVHLHGRALRLSGPADAVRAGIVLVPEDRKHAGLAQDLNLVDNLTLPSLSGMGPVVRRRQVEQQARELAARVELKGHLGQSARTLSGGNQQKAVIAKWLPLSPSVVLFDEPTRGIDVGARAAVYAIIRDLAAAGAGVVVVSSELPEVLGLSHRVLVLSRGRQTGLLDRADADERSVMTAAVPA